MKCRECQDEGKVSMGVVGTSSTTLMGYAPFYDEGGKYHSHDPNSLRTEYRCTEGHEWIAERKATCPAHECEWNAKSRTPIT